MNSKIDEEVIVEDSVIANSTIGRKKVMLDHSHTLEIYQLLVKMFVLAILQKLKNSTIGDDSFASHHAYIGDTKAGKRVNFGCGSVTVNF